MTITQTNIELQDPALGHLRAVVSVLIDDGKTGLIVAMPERQYTDHCPTCKAKTELRARFCTHCGAALGKDRAMPDRNGVPRYHTNICHPINRDVRDYMDYEILRAYFHACLQEVV